MYNRLNPKTEEKLRGILQVGDALDSPRFCWITLKEVFPTVEDMQAAGYTEPTYIDSDRWDVRGRTLSVNSMHFAAAPKMPLYTVEVTETLCKTFTVLAPDAASAEALVQQRYYDADDQEYVLSADDYLQTQFSVFPDADADPYDLQERIASKMERNGVLSHEDAFGLTEEYVYQCELPEYFSEYDRGNHDVIFPGGKRDICDDYFIGQAPGRRIKVATKNDRVLVRLWERELGVPASDIEVMDEDTNAELTYDPVRDCGIHHCVSSIIAKFLGDRYTINECGHNFLQISFMKSPEVKVVTFVLYDDILRELYKGSRPRTLSDAFKVAGAVYRRYINADLAEDTVKTFAIKKGMTVKMF